MEIAVEAMHHSVLESCCEGCAPGYRLRAEVVHGDDLSQIELVWSDLVSRSIIPNVFLSPTIIRVAASARDISVVLVWDETRQPPRLVGLAAFVCKRLRARFPIRVLSGALNSHTYLSNPVIAADLVEPVLHCLLDAIAESSLPKVIIWPEFWDNSDFGQAIRRVLAERQSAPLILDRRQRPVLLCTSGDQSSGPSAKRRSGLRRTRKRLAERGILSTTWHSNPDEVAIAIEEFLALEGSGWKAAEGTALRSHPDDLRFTQIVTAELASKGLLKVAVLRLDGRAVASWVFMRCGDALYAWKIGYDENLSKFGPGMLLLEDCTQAFLADAHLKVVDSCCFDDKGFIAELWSSRRPMIDILFDVRRRPNAVAVLFLRLLFVVRRLKGWMNARLKATLSRLKGWRRGMRFANWKLSKIG